MALNGNRLGDAMLAGIQAAVAGHVAGQPLSAAELTAIWRAIGQAIVAEITTNGVVNVASVSGVTTGAGTSGPGTGTIS